MDSISPWLRFGVATPLAVLATLFMLLLMWFYLMRMGDTMARIRHRVRCEGDTNGGILRGINSAIEDLRCSIKDVICFLRHPRKTWRAIRDNTCMPWCPEYNSSH